MPYVNGHHAIVVAMSYRPGTAARRMHALLEELIEEAGGADTRGAKQQAVMRSGIGQSHFSRIINGQREPGIRQLETVMARLKLRWDYFFGPVEPTTYRDFVGTRYAALSEFFATDEGRTVKPDERVFLSSVAFAAGAPDVRTYGALLAAYRGTYGWRVGRIVDVDASRLAEAAKAMADEVDLGVDDVRFADSDDLDEAVGRIVSRKAKPVSATLGRKAKPVTSVTEQGDARPKHGR